MANIKKRGDGYAVRWRDPDGRERRRQTPTFAAAKKLKQDVEAAVAAGVRWEPRDARARPELEKVLEGYVRRCIRVLKPGTAERYARTLDVFARFLREKHGARTVLHVDILTKQLLWDFYDHLALTGLHGKPRSKDTVRKNVEVVQLMWAWAYEHDEYGEFCFRPRRIEMPRGVGSAPVAPRWEEMDACIAEITGWYQMVCVVMRFTGLRVNQVMHLRWEDFDLDRAALIVRGELGKSKQEQRGRMIPISTHLATYLADGQKDEGWVIESDRGRGGARDRMARDTRVRAAWQAAGVRSAVWAGRPNHAFRKGFISELKRSGADAEAVEYLVGHSLGLRGVYTDPDALPLRDAVRRVPTLKKVVGTSTVSRPQSSRPRSARTAEAG